MANQFYRKEKEKLTNEPHKTCRDMWFMDKDGGCDGFKKFGSKMKMDKVCYWAGIFTSQNLRVLPTITMLETNRLRLREVIFADVDNVHKLLSLPETDQFNTLGIPGNIQMTEKLLMGWLSQRMQEPRNSYVFIIDRKDDDLFIGLIGMNLGKENYRTAKVWFKIHKDFWRRGYTTEALKKVLEFAFYDLKLHRIEAGCSIENAASIKVLEKVGMQREGLKRKKLPIRGEWKDNYFYAILEEDFNEKELGFGQPV